MARSLEKPKRSAEGGGNPCNENTGPFIPSLCISPAQASLRAMGLDK